MRLGVVGLGNMGGALARNLVERGHDVAVFDVAGPERCPEGAVFAADAADAASRSEVLVLSLPDGHVCDRVLREVLAGAQALPGCVLDTSTIGPAAARSNARLLGDRDVGYVDAPVSGGAAGARARTLAVMYAGAPDACTAVQPVLLDLSDRRYHLGDEAGMAQAVKLANNFLAATALAATSEAVAFARAAGVDMATVLEVVNASSGRSAASADKFVEHVLPGRYASGFLNTLMSKDLDLYLASAAEAGAPTGVGTASATLWRRFAEDEPAVDFTRIYPYVQGD